MRFAVPLEVLKAVFQPDLVGLEEAVQFVARLEAQQPPKLSRRKFALPIGFQYDCLKNAACKFLARCRQSRKKVIRNFEHYLRHKLRITQSARWQKGLIGAYRMCLVYELAGIEFGKAGIKLLKRHHP